VGTIDPLRDIKNVEFDLMVSDLGQIEKRLERLEKDLKKMKTPDLEKEFELIKRANAHLGIGKAAARNGDESRGQEAPARLHVPQREADFLCAQHRRVDGTGQGTRRSGRQI
jgi:ribosome-binding ATPase YchF (GTP1/OBG family)